MYDTSTWVALDFDRDISECESHQRRALQNFGKFVYFALPKFLEVLLVVGWQRVA